MRKPVLSNVEKNCPKTRFPHTVFFEKAQILQLSTDNCIQIRALGFFGISIPGK
jgi:hypothetical protein